MKIHHISCGSFHPPFAALVDGRGGIFERASYVVHCLLAELPDGLLLVDTGMSAADMADPVKALGAGMAWAGGAGKGTTAAEHLRALGFALSDVRHIVLTHLDKDHAGGLADFPQARVHAHPLEISAASGRASFIDRQRYNPAHFAHQPFWVPVESNASGSFFGLDCLEIPGLPKAVRILPLPGHSAGHCGIALNDGMRWLLHCGDAVYHRAWLDGRRPTLLLQLVETILQNNSCQRVASRRTLLRLMETGEVTVFCSHDRQAFLELGGIE